VPDSDDPQDWADHHVKRWRDHWVDIEFDDDIEAMFVRMHRLMKFFHQRKQEAAAQAGLQDFEYDTLHSLLIRDTPGVASPTELAADLKVSPAGITGRLDTMERAGWIQRHPVAGDRRRVEVEATRSGVQVWRDAMALRGRDEDRIAEALTADERVVLNQLLKKLTLKTEQTENQDAG
jgi:DNA-binding MarR family transcriptional regulator